MQTILEQETKQTKKPIGILTGIFGCWHQDLSRPFTSRHGESYRVCLHCGARRHFNPETLETYGKFYFSSNN